MILAYCNDETADTTPGMLLAKKADEGEKLTLWNTEVAEDEDPMNAAVRALNTYFTGSDGALGGHMLMPIQVLSTESTDIHPYLISMYVRMSHLNKPEKARHIPLGKLEDWVDQLTPNAHAVVSHLPLKELEDNILIYL